MSLDRDEYPSSNMRRSNNMRDQREDQRNYNSNQLQQMEVPSISNAGIGTNQIPLYYPVHIHAGVIRQRIDGVRSAFAPLCASFHSYAKRSSHMRDAGDQISKRLFLLAEHCNYNASMQGALLNFSRWISALQDCENTRAMRINAKVVAKLSQYKEFCARVEDDIKSGETSSIKQKTMFSSLQQQNNNSNNTMNVRDALTNYRESARTMDSSLSVIQQAADQFEHKKLTDMKQILSDYVLIELKYHCKALEMYSEAFCTLKNIDIASDFEEYRQNARSGGGGGGDLKESESIDENEETYNARESRKQQQRPQQRQRQQQQQQQQQIQPLPDPQQGDWKYGVDFYEQQERDQQRLRRQTRDYYYTGGAMNPPEPAAPDPNHQAPPEQSDLSLPLSEQFQMPPAIPGGPRKKRNTLFLSTPAPQYAQSIIAPKPEKLRRQVIRKGWWPLSRNASTTNTTAATGGGGGGGGITPANTAHLNGTMSLTTIPPPPPQTMTIEIPVAGSYVIGGDEKARIRERIRRRLENEFGGESQQQQQQTGRDDDDNEADNIQNALEEQIATRTMKITRAGGGGGGGATTTTTTTSTKRNVQRAMLPGMDDDMFNASLPPLYGNDPDVDDLEKEFGAIIKTRQQQQSAKQPRPFADNDDDNYEDEFDYEDAYEEDEEVIAPKPMRKVNRPPVKKQTVEQSQAKKPSPLLPRSILSPSTKTKTPTPTNVTAAAADVNTEQNTKNNSTTITKIVKTKTTTNDHLSKKHDGLFDKNAKPSKSPAKNTTTAARSPKKRVLRIAAHATSYHVTDYDHGKPTIFTVPTRPPEDSPVFDETRTHEATSFHSGEYNITSLPLDIPQQQQQQLQQAKPLPEPSPPSKPQKEQEISTVVMEELVTETIESEALPPASVTPTNNQPDAFLPLDDITVFPAPLTIMSATNQLENFTIPPLENNTAIQQNVAAVENVESAAIINNGRSESMRMASETFRAILDNIDAQENERQNTNVVDESDISDSNPASNDDQQEQPTPAESPPPPELKPRTSNKALAKQQAGETSPQQFVETSMIMSSTTESESPFGSDVVEQRNSLIAQRISNMVLMNNDTIVTEQLPLLPPPVPSVDLNSMAPQEEEEDQIIQMSEELRITTDTPVAAEGEQQQQQQ